MIKSTAFGLVVAVVLQILQNAVMYIIDNQIVTLQKSTTMLLNSVEKKKFPSPIPDLSIKSKTPDAPLDSLSSLSESPGEGDDELESDEEEDLDIVSKEDSPSDRKSACRERV